MANLPHIEIQETHLAIIAPYGITKGAISSYEWTWPCHTIYPDGFLPELVRDQFQYLSIVLKTGIRFEFVKDTLSDKVFLNAIVNPQ